MWATLLKAVLGSIFGELLKANEEKAARERERKSAVVEMEKDYLEKEIKSVIEATERRRRIAFDPAYRDWVRLQIQDRNRP
jgi:hypothetical protein